uniref:Uncharacterized protein n=1 Tax=Leersia perrieri TaxID=77586 RepID=A0A0D9XQ64_9ORYZ
MLHLRQRLLLPLLRAAAAHPNSSSSSSAAASSATLHLSRILLSTTAAIPFTAEDYLVATCGLTGDQARVASARISHLKSASNPDAVLAHLSGVGLSRADLAAVVAADPRILCARAHNIARRIASLRDGVGLSDPQIRSLLLSGGVKVLRECDLALRLEFWIPFLGSFERLLTMVKTSNVILTSDLDKVIKPNIALLQECGLTVRDIVKLARHGRMLTSNPKQVETFVQRCSEENIRSKIEFLASTLGCSQEKVCAAVCKQPQILGLSADNHRRKINFMVTEVGLEPKCIMENPVLLTYSLEKRLVPRYSVIKILRAMGLIKGDVNLNTLLAYSEKYFISRYIDPYKQEAPAIADAYAAACTGENMR